jgi:hypothetical protein
MNRLIKLFLILLISTLLFSCEDVIQIDLNSANPAIVLEAEITDITSESTVLITKSTDFYTVGEYERVSNAVVIISDENGKTAEMVEVNPGDYRGDLGKGSHNTKYFVEVNVDGKIYNAESRMPHRVEIDSLTIEKSKFGPRNDNEKENYILHIHFKDEPNIDNYCRFRITHNGKDLSGFVVYEDKYTDGNDIDARIRLDGDEIDLNIGDLIIVELQSIDKATYDFYKTANSVNASGSSSGGGGPSSTSVAPTNPVSNWTNNALGYFSAYTSDTKSITLTK